MKSSTRNIFLLVFGILILCVISVMASSIFTNSNVQVGNVTYDSNGNLTMFDGNSYRSPSSGTADVVVCRGTSIFDDYYKSSKWLSGCDVVCKSTDEDCGNELTLAYSKLSGTGGSLYIATGFYNVATKIDFTGKNSTYIHGSTQGIDNGNYGTWINWTGGADTIIDLSSANYIHIENLGMNGNNKAINGLLFGNNYAKHPQHNRINKITVSYINGTAINLTASIIGGSMVDSDIQDIYITNVLTGINFDGQQMTIINPVIAQSNIGLQINTYSSGQVYGGVFSGNNKDLELGGDDSISKWLFSGVWFENSNNYVLGRSHTPGITANIYDMTFESCRLQTSSTVLMNLTNIATQINIIGGDNAGQVAPTIIMPSTSYLSVVSGSRSPYNLTGAGSKNSVYLQNGKVYFGNKLTSIYNDGSLAINSNSDSDPTDVYLNYPNSTKNLLLYFSKIQLANSTSVNTKICMDGNACAKYLQWNGTCIYSSGSGNCV